MNPKQKIAGSIIFASVFFGSLMGAGISLITSPKSVVKNLKNKVLGTSDVLREGINDQLDNATVIFIENTTQILTKAKTKLGGLNATFSSIKDNISSVILRK